MRYREYAPTAELAPYVRYLWSFEKDEGDDLFAYDRFMPEAEPLLLFQLEGAYRRAEPSGGATAFGEVIACGGCREPMDTVVPGRFVSVGVRFNASGAAALGAFSPAELGGLADFPEPWARGIQDRLLETRRPGSDAEPRRLIDVLEGGLLRLAETARPDRLPSGVDPLPGCSGCPRSTRQFERRCRATCGYTPRDYRALKRCGIARSVLFLEREPDLTGLALDLGFCDLSHFCNTFKRWSGMSPLRYARYCAPFRAIMRGDDAMSHCLEESGRIRDAVLFRRSGARPLHEAVREGGRQLRAE